MNGYGAAYGAGSNALGNYRGVEAYGAAAAGDRVQLILRMMQGALDRIATARGHLLRGEAGPKGEAIGRAVRLIDGLRACLDPQRAGPDGDAMIGNLGALYDYMVRRLTEANLRNDGQALDEVARLLGELRSAWQELATANVGTAAARAGSAS